MRTTDTLEASLRSLGTAITLAAIGVYLHRRGFVEKEGKKTLAILSQQVTFPLFLFTKINACKWATKCINVNETLHDAWVLLLWPLYVVIAGLLVGMLVTKVAKTPKHNRNAVLASCAFANSTGLPITLLTVVHDNFPVTSNLGRVDPTLFLSIYLLLYPVLQWGIGGWLLAASSSPSSPKEEEEQRVVVLSPIQTLHRNILNSPVTDHYFSQHKGLASTDEGIYLSQPDLVHMDYDTENSSGSEYHTQHNNNNNYGSADETVQLVAPPPPTEEQPLMQSSPSWTQKASCLQTLHNIVSRSLQPPVVGALMGILFAVTPLRNLVVDVHHSGPAPLEWIFDALYEVGKAAVPINMMILGCNLSASVKSMTSDALERTGMLSIPSMVGIVVGKLILLPLIGILTVLVLRNFVLDIPEDIEGSFYLTLMIVFLCPTANNVMVMVELAGYETKEGIAMSIALQYLVAPAILTFTMTIAIGIASKWS